MAKPKMPIISPDILFIQTSVFGEVNLYFTILPKDANNTHQSIEPNETPSTRVKLSFKFPGVMFKPAKMTIKDKMVMGFVIVKRNVEITAFNKLLFSILTSESFGFLRNVL